ncbi:hypothetical protein ACWGIN_17320 [Streptomyces sp. NPDC054861]
MPKLLTVFAIAIEMAGGGNSVAFAESTDPVPIEEGVLQPGPPAERDEAGFLPAPADEAELPPATPPKEGTDAEYCQPKNVHRPTANLGKSHQGIGATQANYNATSRTARAGKHMVWRMKNTGTSYTIYSNCRTSARAP